jgi:Zn-finger protein
MLTIHDCEGHRVVKMSHSSIHKRNGKCSKAICPFYTLMNNSGSLRESGEKLKYLEISESGITIYHNLWDAAKVVLRKFIAISIYIKRKKYFKETT